MLKISYSELSSVTSRMETQAGNVMGVYEDMLKVVTSLVHRGYMEAESANAYIDNFTSLIGPSITELNSLLVSFYTQLNTICENFSDIDARIASAIRR